MTAVRPRCGTLVDMTTVEAIYLVAALLWIAAVVVVMVVGVRFAVRYRARRRQVNRLLAVAWIPLRLFVRPARDRTWRDWADEAWANAYYGSASSWRSGSSARGTHGPMKEMKKIIASNVKMASAERRSPHWKG